MRFKYQYATLIVMKRLAHVAYCNSIGMICLAPKGAFTCKAGSHSLSIDAWWPSGNGFKSGCKQIIIFT